MSKRCASPASPTHAKRAREADESLDDYHKRQVAEWEAVQTRFSEAMKVSYSGMISEVDAAASLRAHRTDLAEKGYKFGTYNTDRSLFEKLDRIVFQDTPDAFMGREIL